MALLVGNSGYLAIVNEDGTIAATHDLGAGNDQIANGATATDDGHIIVVGYNYGTDPDWIPTGLWFRTLDGNDLTQIGADVLMDDAFGNYDTGALFHDMAGDDPTEIWVCKYPLPGFFTGGPAPTLPIALLVLNYATGGNDYNLYVFDAADGSYWAENDSLLTSLAPAGYGGDSYATGGDQQFQLNRTGDHFQFGVWKNSPGVDHIAEMRVDFTPNDVVPLSWDFNDAQFLDGGQEYWGFTELPGGDFLVQTYQGAPYDGGIVRVARDGTNVTPLFQVPPFDAAHSANGAANIVLSEDGTSFWVGYQVTPDSVGLSPPPGGSGTVHYFWATKVDLATGDLISTTPILAMPFDTFMLPYTPVAGGGSVLVVRDIADDAPAVDSVIRSVWRPSGELISNPVKLSITPFVPPGQPPLPEPVPHGPPPILSEPVTRKRRKRSPVQSIVARNVSPWGSDVLVSRPEPTPHPVTRDFGGIAMTAGGLAHNVNEDAIETLFTPTYSPLPHRSNDDG